MVKALISCNAEKSTRDKTWPYEEYYFGEKDAERRKNGQGVNHWTGAKSIEWYTGSFVRDTMHGKGDYRWRHGPDGAQTYEGYFYANRLHGYGTTSYADGSVFRGLFHTDCRWGAGVLTHINRQEDVGLWRGSQLVRLAWRPPVMSVVPDLLAVPGGTDFVEPHRLMLASRTEIIGETNSALELLKHYGVKPAVAAQRWPELYPRFCTDVNSALFHKAVFDQAYFGGKIRQLKECSEPLDRKREENDSVDTEDLKTHFAWNNSDTMIKFMKHSFTHDWQRMNIGFDLVSILSGYRKRFKAPGKHEFECRTLLMACYLGDIPVVTTLINQSNIHPNIADMQGNTALMYAVCGDQTDIVDFLIDAGASVDSFNDACCTALGIALMRLAAAKKDISHLGTVSAMMPPQVAVPPKIPIETSVSEWNILRNQLAIGATPTTNKTQSKMATKTGSMRKIKSITSVRTEKSMQRMELEDDNEEMTKEKRLFIDISNEYESHVNSTFTEANPAAAPYIFETNDMVREIDAYEAEFRKPAAPPKKNTSKVLKDAKKSSKILLDKLEKDDVASINSAEMNKQQKLDRIMLTILHLLTNRADPRLVRCPQPALPMALVAGNADLVKYLVQNGANVNENYHRLLGYSPLEMAISRPLNQETLELVRSLLESGANANRRLPYSDYTDNNLILQAIHGPTLLHAVLVKKTDGYYEEEIRNALIDLLLDSGCDANALFKGRSAIELAMTKDINILNVLINNSKTDLNGIINEANQTILVKMFSIPFCGSIEEGIRLQILTNLLLYGADPFMECQNGEEKYANLFVYAKKVLDSLESTKSGSGGGGKSDAKGKKPETKDKKVDAKKGEDNKKDDKQGGKSMGKNTSDAAGDYRQALDLVTECARMLRVRWIQGKLVKELVGIIDKYKHRAWHLIIKEHKSQEIARLWLTAERCVEIWDILKATRKRVYEDSKVLKMLLCIVQYYRTRDQMNQKLSFKEKKRIETEVSSLLKERSVASGVTAETTWMRPCVQPELMTRCENKFNVCFECSLPITEHSIQCVSCKLVSFCDLNCMKENVERCNGHPCSEQLKAKYFQSPEGSNRSLTGI